MKYIFRIDELDCANCANKIEMKLNKESYIETAELNFMLKKLTIYSAEEDKELLRSKVEQLADEIEKGVKVLLEEDEEEHVQEKKYTFQVESLDCGNCAAKIEAKLNKEPYIESAELNFMLKKLTIVSYEQDEEALRQKVEKLADAIEKGVRILSEGEDETVLLHEGHQHGSCCTGHESHEKCTSGCNEYHYSHESAHNHQSSPKAAKENKINKEKLKTSLLIIGCFLFGAGIVTDIDILFFISYVCVGYDIVIGATKNVFKGRMLDENFLMTLATIAAFAIREYPEAVAVMIFYKVGEYMQGKAVGYSRKEIAKAMDIRPDFARVIRNGKEEVVTPQAVRVGEILEIRVGEKLPLDGVIIEGSTSLDTSMLTGEAVPLYVTEGSEVLSGSINKEGIIKVKVTTSFKNSTVSKILELIENATSKKSKSENFITKFARVYTPIVVGLAIFTAIIPSLITGNWDQWIYSSIVFLVVSCPCAVVVSVPLGFFAGLGASAHKGVLVKGSNYLEELNTIDTIVLDKTGTITKGEFGITEVVEAAGTREEILQYAASLEKSSNHPIARSIVKAYDKELLTALSEIKEVSGEGLVASFEGSNIIVGNEKLMDRYQVAIQKVHAIGSHIYVAKDQSYLGCIVVADQIKSDSKEAIAKLKAQGIKKVIMLTGDKAEIANKVGNEVGVDEVYAELLPQHKVEKVEEMLKTGRVAFVGDGINDAPVLARADIGVAMGGVGSDAAIEASDVVLMTDELSSISEVLKVAKRTRTIVMQNIIFALGVKVIVLVLGIFGIANMWLAIFADVGVSLLAVMNSIRVLGGNLGYIKKMFTSK